MNAILQWMLGYDSRELAGVSWRLGLVADYGPYVRLGLLLAAVALAALVVRSYRREGDAPRRLKGVLMALRLATLAVVLLALLRPAIVLRFVDVLHNSVVVLLDDSLSMSYADRYANEPDRRALAGALGVEADTVGSLSRSEVARRVLGGADSPIEALRKDHNVVLMRFSTTQPGREAYTRELGRLGQANVAARPPADLAAMLGRLDAGGFETNLAAALRDAMEAQAGRRIDALVLVSDGQMTSEDGPMRLAGAGSYAAQQGIPIYPLLVGDPTPPKNVAVVGLQGPREARCKSRIELSAVLSHRNLAGERVRIRLLARKADQAEWTDTGVAAETQLDGEDASSASKGVQTVSMNVEPDCQGEMVYKAVIDPRSDERDVSDNSAEAVVKVLDGKLNVLLVSGDAGWEFQYLRDFLYRDDLYRVSVWQQNADPEVSQTASTGMKLTRLPKDLSELIGVPGDKEKPGYDVIVLYDPQPTRDGFDEHFIGLLKTWVQVHGGGLCYIAGNKYFEAMVRGQQAFRDLADLLPVEPAGNRINIEERIGREIPQAWPVELTSYGQDHPLTRLSDSAPDSLKVWQVLPGIYWSHAVTRVKPAARVLAVSSNTLRRTARNEPEPLLAVQPVGKGTVMYMGFDATWRWRAVQDGMYHRRYWGNVVRFLASLKARQVVITAGGDRFPAGQRITIEAEAYDDQYRPLTGESFDVTVVNVQTGRKETVTLGAVEGRPGRYRANYVPAHTGAYDLTAMDGNTDKVAGKRIVIELPRAEARRSEADEPVMRQLASRPEYFLQAWQAGKLPQLVGPGKRVNVREVPRELWDTRLTLLLCVLLLTVEWVLRKKNNMA